jgi:hypothetical protein
MEQHFIRAQRHNFSAFTYHPPELLVSVDKIITKYSANPQAIFKVY